MSTSLAEQLQRLAVPQTTRLLRDKKRPSLLFDPKEAANLDRDTVYEIGLSGLEELQKCNYLFKTFEHNLFGVTSKTFERSVENVEANEKLNEQIKKFLLLLSPYFLLKSAHKSLEWLISRYQIHEYNKEEFLMLILPYHETNIYVRCLQLIEFREADKWYWLKSKHGVHLPKILLFNHCASDAYFLNFVCRSTLEHIQYHEKPVLLTVVFNFYCTTIVGGLEHSESINETQVSQILPYLLKGLSSEVNDFIAASFIILAKLVAKVQLSEKLLKRFVEKVAKVSVPSLRTEASLVLLIIYQSQHHFQLFPTKAVEALAKDKWLPAVLEKLRASGSYVVPFWRSLTHKCFVLLFENPVPESEMRNFLDLLLSEVKLDDGFVEAMFGNLLELYNPKEHKSQQHLQWLENFLKLMENGNTSAFDKTVQMHLKNSSTDPKQRKNLSRLLKMSVRSANFDIVEKLYHPSAKFRTEALGFLIRKVNTLGEQDMELLKTTLVERLGDEDPLVIEETLNVCKDDNIVSLLDFEDFFKGLIRLTTKCATKITDDKDWKKVVGPLLGILCSETFRSRVNQDVRLFFALLPFLLPTDPSCICFVQQIVQSSFGQSGVFQKTLPPISNQLSTIEVGKIILEHVSLKKIQWQLAKPTFEEICAQKGDFLRKYLSSLLIVYVFPLKSQIHDAFSVFDTLLQLLSQPQVKFVKVDIANDATMFDSWNLMARKGYLPLQGLLSCLQIFISRISVSAMISFDFWPDTNQNKFILTYLDYLLTNCFNATLNKYNIFSDLLNQYLNTICDGSLERKVEFLCNVAICNNRYKTEALTLRCLRVVGGMINSLDVKTFNLNNVSQILVPTVLISLVNQYAEIRQTAFEIVSILIVKFGIPNCLNVLHEIVEYKEEIILDPEQLPLILYTILSKPEFESNLKSLTECVSDNKYPKYVTASTLGVLQHINSYEIFSKSSQLAVELFKDSLISDATVSEIIYRNILRFNCETSAEIELNSNVWNFLERALKMDDDKLANLPDKNIYPSTLLLNQIDKDLFAKLNVNVQQELINLVVTLASETLNPDVISAVNRAVKRIDLDVKHVRPLLEAMRDVQSQKEIDSNRKRRVRVIPTIDVLEMLPWRKGVSVLEFLQDKKKLRNTALVIPVLFEVLKKCLDFEEQASVEYPKQLLLSCILNCCTKMTEAEKSQSQSVFNIELVVQCVRASQNPQTHHHALLVLAEAASIIPQQLLYHIMSVFTFMGSSILRHDDSYSSQLISKIIDTIIPILIDENVPAVIRVFVDALLDIPEHRRLPLLHQLLSKLDARQHLWTFLVLVFEAQVLHGNESKTKQPLAKVRGVESTEIVKKRLDIAADLARMFEPEIILENCIKVMDYLRTLPEEKDSETTSQDAPPCHTFNINQHTAKQFRHFKYVIVTFATQLLSSKEFVTQVAQLSNERMLAMEGTFRSLVISVLTFIATVSKTADRNANSPQSQYWKVMLHHSYDILDSVNALLTCQMFLLVIRALMAHNLATVRRRSLELLNSKLQFQSSFFDDHDDEELFALLDPLLSTIKTAHVMSAVEQEVIQQTALLSLKLIVRLKGNQYPEKFLPILNFVTELVRSEKVQGNILASSVLCLAELCSNLRAHAIPNLSKFMPALIKVMRSQRTSSPDLLLLSVITAIKKVLDSLPLFLSPYLEKILCELSILTSKLDMTTDDQKLAPFVAKLSAIKQKIGSVIPTRVLLPSLDACYNGLIAKERYFCVSPLMDILSENLTHLHGSDVNGMLPDLQTFFMGALQFRADRGSTLTTVEANEVEEHLIRALSTLILKLSETSFRPIYYRLYEWAVRSEVKTERVITFYGFSRAIAQNLKGLFVLFAGHFLNNVAILLDACNVTKCEHLYFEDVSKNVLLLENILHTLYFVFMYDSQKFVNKDRFDTLMQQIVDQLENTLDGEEALRERAQRIITPCIVQFAVATADDALWKQMNYQILLKTRNSSSCIRLIALECLEEVTKKLGEDFLPLLPETIPFLAEMLEDEDEDVEKATQKAIQQMEKVLGEPLRKYF